MEMNNGNFDESKSLIDKSLLNLFPDWWKHLDKDKYYLVMTDDADSFYSCQKLHSLFGLEIGGFYDFKSGLYTNWDYTDLGLKIPVFVDLSICQNYLCFDNHRTIIENPNAVNPNKIQRTYSQKYNFSTLALLAGLYGGVDGMTDEQKYALIAIDGGYIGYYKDGGRWKDVNVFWLKKLGLDKYLLPILEEKNMQFFIDYISDYGLREKIFINEDGFLESSGAYDLPEYPFELEQAVENHIGVSLIEMQDRYRANEPILVSAETYKNKYVMNVAV